MKCLRCGVEVDDGQVFCPRCQANMERSPVAPGSVVYIPKPRELPIQRRAAKRRSASPEEQIRSLKHRIRVLHILLGFFVALALLFAYPAFHNLPQEQSFLPGQNYSSYSTDATRD